MATATSRRVTNPPTSSRPKRDWLGGVSRQIERRPSAAIVYGVPGIGKTSLAANMPGAVFMIDSSEDGINRLKESGLADSSVPVLPPVSDWIEAHEVLDALLNGEHDYKALALDALGGFERLCHEEVCRREYSGEWGERGFTSYMRGFETSLTDWRLFLQKLDQLRDKRSMSIMLLGHAKVTNFKNPEGPDYDRYLVDVHHKTWSLTHKWADMVLFANYEVEFGKDANQKKAKAQGGHTRVIHTEHSAAWDAKNRHNLPPIIDMGSTGKEAFSNLQQAIREGRKNGASDQ